MGDDPAQKFIDAIGGSDFVGNGHDSALSRWLLAVAPRFWLLTWTLHLH
jgi:hypothetical protein